MDVEWRVINVRLSLFFKEQRPDNEKLWNLLTGQNEAISVVQQFGVTWRTGFLLDCSITLSSASNRIDIIAQCDPSKSNDGATIGTLHPFLEIFQAQTVKWLSCIDFDISRIAFGCLLISYDDDVKSSYFTLNKLIKSVNIIPGKMQDFSYMVNWPVLSKFKENLLLNRLSKWSSMIVGGKMFAASLGADVGATTEIPTIRGPGVELDLSTPAESEITLTQNDLVPIYDELIALAIENAQRGEITCE